MPVTEREPGFQDELPPTARGSDGPTPQPVNDGPPDIGTPTPVSPNAGQLKVDYKEGKSKEPKRVGRKGGKKADNKAIDEIVKRNKLSKGQRSLLHREISKQGYPLPEIEEIARDIKREFPNK